jgi:hypothetical protein
MLASPLLFHFRVGRPTFASLWIVCGALLMFGRVLDQPRVNRALALGIFLVAALFTDFQIVLFAALWLFIYGIYRLARERSALFNRTRMVALGVAALMFAIPFFVLYYPTLSRADALGYLHMDLDAMRVYSFRYWDYFTLDVIPFAYGYEFLVAALLAVILFRQRGRYRFWLVSAILFLLLALGPYLQPTNILLPFAAFSWWSPLSQFRTPARLTMAAVVGFAVVLGLVLKNFLPRLRSRALVWGLTIIAISGRLLFGMNHDPFLVQTYPDYAIYHQLAREPGDGALLEVPFGVRSGIDVIGQGGEILEYYQHIHGKPMLNGMIARLPTSVFEFYRSHPALMFLSGTSAQAHPNDLTRDFDDVLRWSKARYVLLHRSLLEPEQVNLIETFLEQQPQLTRVSTERDLIVYRVKP